MIEIPPLIGLRMINDGSVSLISTRMEERTNVAVVSWQMPISQNPPMVAISLSPSSLTNHFLKRTGEFVLGIPDASLIAETHYVGTHSGKAFDKMRLMELLTIRAHRVSPLLITNCIGHLECVVREWRLTGDHILYEAEVITALVDQEYFEGGWNENAQTLHHLGGDSYRVGGTLMHALKFPLPQAQPRIPLFKEKD